MWENLAIKHYILLELTSSCEDCGYIGFSITLLIMTLKNSKSKYVRFLSFAFVYS